MISIGGKWKQWCAHEGLINLICLPPEMLVAAFSDTDVSLPGKSLSHSISSLILLQVDFLFTCFG